MKIHLLLAVATLATASFATTFGLLRAQTQPVQAQMPGKCFYITQFRSWRAPDAKTIVIRVNLHDYYRLDLSGECGLLTFPGTHLITKTRGPETVCSALDWDLSVAESEPGAIPEPCIVKTMTPMTPADVAALPPKFRP